MQRLDRVHENRGRTDARKSRRHLAADMAAFADAGKDQFAAAPDTFAAQPGRLLETCVEAVPHRLHSGDFDIEDLARPVQNLAHLILPVQRRQERMSVTIMPRAPAS